MRKDKVDVNTRVYDCMQRPHLRCFTSWDSNWTLNAVLISRKAMLERQFRYPDSTNAVGKVVKGKPFGTLADYGLAHAKQQDGFEVGLLNDDWGALQVPICLGYQGFLLHEEIDG